MVDVALVPPEEAVEALQRRHLDSTMHHLPALALQLSSHQADTSAYSGLIALVGSLRGIHMD